MKSPRFFPSGRTGCLFVIVNALLAVGLTFASLAYVRPKDCSEECVAPEGEPCPSGACRIGEQRAGWPLPVLIDSPGGGSPTNGWGKLGPEDPPIISTFLLDTLFYSILLWLAFSIVRAVRRQALPMKLMAVSLPMTAVAGAFVWLVFAIVQACIAG